MKFDHVYFINGTAYAGKSTLVRRLAEKHGGIACEENYHDRLEHLVTRAEFPNLSYTKELADWHDFIRRTPDEYEAWIDGVTKECEILELRILEAMQPTDRPVFVDTNISLETLREIALPEHVLIMLADPEVSVGRFFNRPDKEKQFLYRLMMEEPDPQAALENFRRCLERVNSRERYEAFAQSGFHVLLRDDGRSIEETMALAEAHFGLIP